MNPSRISRRQFSRVSLASLLAAATEIPAGGSTAAETSGPGGSMRRTIIKQELPGEPRRELSLVEVTYPPGTGSPPHLHANGVMAFVVSGEIASRVGEGPEQTFSAGQAWWEPPGAAHRVSRNASATQPATLLAIYIAPPGAGAAELMKTL